MRGYFVKYLAMEGWDVHVVTTGARHGFFLDWVTDYSFYEEIKKHCHIRTIPSSRWGITGEILFTLKVWPSMLWDWIKKVNELLPQIINQQGIVFANYPDIANFHIGLEIKKRYSLPLVLDLRDDYFHHDMKEFIAHADIIFTTTETIKDKIHRDFQFPQEKIFAIYNGYSDPLTIAPRPPAPGRLNIIYAGTIARHQKPEILNLAYRRLMEKHPDLKGKIQIEVYGQKNYYFHWYYKKTLTDGIRFNDFIPYGQLKQKMLADIDIGFFSLADDVYSYATPTKLFDYINLELPILAALPEGESKNIIEKYRIGKVAHYSDVDRIADIIYEYYKNPLELQKMRENIRKIKDRFDIRIQVKQMSDLLKQQLAT